MKFTIYQLKRTNERKDYGFLGFDDALKFIGENFYPKLKDYKKVYEGNIDSEDNATSLRILEKIYAMFNIAVPSDFRGHSLSVSDVICLDNTFYYVDRIGYQKLDNKFFI